MTHEFEVNAIIPDPDGLGLTVVGIADLLMALGEAESLDEAITNAGFDTIWLSPRNTPEQKFNVLMSFVERVRNLNNTGDSKAYWDTE